MARGDRGADGRYRGTALMDRAAQIRRNARVRYTGAETPAEQLAAAVDYLRVAAIAVEKAGLGGAPSVLAQVTQALMAGGDQLTAALDQEAGHDRDGVRR